MLRATLVLGLISLVVGFQEDTDRIINGTTALIKEAPCVVSFQRRGVHKCGGFIISPKLVVTAAHCIEGLKSVSIDQLSIRAGATMWSAGGQVIKLIKMFSHPEYESDSKKYDVGILVLSKALDLDDTAVEKCTLSSKIPTDHLNGTIFGWGLKNEKSDDVSTMLQKAIVITISREKCSSADYGYNTEIKETMFCAKNEGVDACQGDSGGPLIIDKQVVGVTSFGKGCGRQKYPGVYTIIAMVKSWISKYLKLYKDSF